jgi:hypothetical protein
MLETHMPAPPMTSIGALLTRKQDLLSRLEECPGPNERDEIERLLDKIDAELNAVDSWDRVSIPGKAGGFRCWAARSGRRGR